MLPAEAHDEDNDVLEDHGEHAAREGEWQPLPRQHDRYEMASNTGGKGCSLTRAEQDVEGEGACKIRRRSARLC